MAVVAVMVIEVSPVAVGATAKVIGSGEGAMRSGEAVVAEAGAEGAVSFPAASRARTV